MVAELPLEPLEAEADHHCQNLKSVAVALPEVYLDLLHSKLEAEANQEAPRSATEKRVLMSAIKREPEVALNSHRFSTHAAVPPVHMESAPSVAFVPLM